MDKDLGTGDIGTPECLEKKPSEIKGTSHLDPLVISRIILDWKSGKYTCRDLHEIYGVSESTISRHTKGIQKGELTEEVLEILESKNRGKMLQALENEGLDEKYVARKIKELCENTDPMYIKAGVQEFNKIKGNYKDVGAKKVDNRKTMNLVQLPPRREQEEDSL